MRRHFPSVAATVLAVWTQMAVAVCEEKTFWTVQVFVFQNQLIDNHGFDGSQVEIYKAEKDELSALSRLLSLQPVPLDQLFYLFPSESFFSMLSSSRGRLESH